VGYLKELEGLFEAFYSRFILRDVFGKIIPGAILLLSLYIAFIRPDICAVQAIGLLKSLSIATWVILGSISWVMAYGVQRIGELLKILHYYGCWIQNDKSWFDKIVRFTEVASPAEKSNFERFVVIKETSGNVGMSFLLSAVILFIFWDHNKNNIGVLLALFLSGVILLSMHRIHVKKNTWWLESVLEFRGTPEKGLPYRQQEKKSEKGK